MINKKVEEAFNEQIKKELESAYIYLSMAAYCHSLNLDGMAQWFRVQTMEEMVHAMKFFDHIRDRGGKVTLQDLKQIKTEWTSPLEAFQDAYKHEQFISGCINNLVKLVQEEGDYPAMPLLNWFVEEQIEEEASTSKVANDLANIGESKDGLIMLDRELGARVFTIPPTAKEFGALATGG